MKNHIYLTLNRLAEHSPGMASELRNAVNTAHYQCYRAKRAPDGHRPYTPAETLWKMIQKRWPEAETMVRAIHRQTGAELTHERRFREALKAVPMLIKRLQSDCDTYGPSAPRTQETQRQLDQMKCVIREWTDAK